MTAQRSSERISCTETAKLIRSALKRAFPGVKFSVTSNRYAGGASIDVAWTDGPITKQVERIAKSYQGADFDGMIDLKTHNTHYLLPDGSAVIADREGTEASKGTISPEHRINPHPDAKRVRFGADYVFCRRRESPAFLAGFRAAWRAMSPEERSKLMQKTGAYQAAHDKPAGGWRYDDELTDFGREAEAVFRCMARQVPA